ncbi:MAG: sterol desaturase family protein [Rhizobiales bacterium]|nr:sterol desaturase family protein [Hyphomicrobiales bacterium]MBI3672321.1 sterol desaturase family protein [Hyphomicrobiales bacterium]
MRFLKSDRQWADSIDPRASVRGGQFLAIYASHYAVILYLGVVLATGWLAVHLMQSPWQLLGSLAIVVVIYPVIEFCLHRFVLHSRALYRKPWTAGLWRRIHYGHHMNPSDLSVLFGAPYTTIPAVLVPTLPIGYLAFGWPGAAAAVCGGFIALMIYEFFHCAAHLPVRFASPTMQYMRRHHLLHHFHSENGNFGIVTNVFDRLIGTEYEAAGQVGQSPTVKNLGYCGDEVRKFPWVAELDHAPNKSQPAS